jgi:hypothetical protein
VVKARCSSWGSAGCSARSWRKTARQTSTRWSECSCSRTLICSPWRPQRRRAPPLACIASALALVVGRARPAPTDTAWQRGRRSRLRPGLGPLGDLSRHCALATRNRATRRVRHGFWHPRRHLALLESPQRTLRLSTRWLQVALRMLSVPPRSRAVRVRQHHVRRRRRSLSGSGTPRRCAPRLDLPAANAPTG